LGTIAVAVGIVGIFVPLLPTTPLLLLAAACYMRSSERLYRWVITNRWFGDYIRNYREGRGVRPKAKIATLTLLWATIGFSCLCATQHWGVRGILLLIAVAVTVHVLAIPTYRGPGTIRKPEDAISEKCESSEGERP
jgi:hypothetical protein